MALVGVEEEEGDDDLKKRSSQCIAPASLGFMIYSTHTLYPIRTIQTHILLTPSA